MQIGRTLLPALALISVAGCENAPTAPAVVAVSDVAVAAQRAGPPRGTGLVLENVITLPVDVVGEVPVSVDAVITGLQFSTLTGLNATFDLIAETEVAGTRIIREDLVAAVSLSSAGGRGGCEVVTVNLAPVNVDAAGLGVVDIPAADVAARAEGAAGTLLCVVTRLVQALAPIDAILGVVNALTGILGGGAPALPLSPVEN